MTRGVEIVQRENVIEEDRVEVLNVDGNALKKKRHSSVLGPLWSPWKRCVLVVVVYLPAAIAIASSMFSAYALSVRVTWCVCVCVCLSANQKVVLDMSCSVVKWLRIFHHVYMYVCIFVPLTKSPLHRLV